MVLLTLSFHKLLGQSHVLSGQILGEDNKPLLGAVVSATYVSEDKNYKQGPNIAQAITNSNGKFSLELGDFEGIMLTARHLGFATQKIKVQEAQQELSIVLSEQALPMDEIVVFSIKGDQSCRDIAVPVGITTADQWSSWLPRDLSEVAENIPGVSRSSDGVWANSINIRGFGADRYVSLVNGKRIETATDLQGALSTIDMDDVEKVEVIKGGISSLYGSGALGGAINVITKQAVYSSRPYLQGNAAIQYHSVNNLWSPKSTLYAGSQNWNAKLHFAYRETDEAQSPEGTIANSHFRDWNLSGSIALRPMEKHEILLEYQKFDGSAGIPGGANFPSMANATYLDFDRELISAEYFIHNPLPALKSISAKYFMQDIFRNVEIIPNAPAKRNNGGQITPLNINPSANHITNGLLLESNWKLGSQHSLVVGYDLWQRNLESQRTRQILQEKIDADGNVTSGIILTRGEKPIPTSSFRSSGIFTQYDLEMNSVVNLTVGGRLDWITLSNETSKDPEYLIREGMLVEEPPGQLIVYPAGSNSNMTWAANAGISYHVSDEISLTASYGRSFRAPSLEERYKYINLGHTVELGNAGLVPEEGNFVDTGIKISSSRIHFTGNLFMNYIDKMITLAPADSVSFLMSNETDFSQLVFTRRYKNIDKALLTGFELGIDWLLYPGSVAYGQFSFVRGLEQSTKENLPGIVPPNGVVGWRQQLSKIANLDLRSRFFGDQDNIAEGEVATDGYVLLDCYVSSEPISFYGTRFQFTLGIDNVLNTSYRNHLSTNRGNWMLEPGRNIKFRFSVTW